MARFCTKCGTQLNREDLFCLMCGTRVAQTSRQGTPKFTEERGWSQTEDRHVQSYSTKMEEGPREVQSEPRARVVEQSTARRTFRAPVFVSKKKKKRSRKSSNPAVVIALVFIGILAVGAIISIALGLAGLTHMGANMKHRETVRFDTGFYSEVNSLDLNLNNELGSINVDFTHNSSNLVHVEAMIKATDSEGYNRPVYSEYVSGDKMTIGLSYDSQDDFFKKSACDFVVTVWAGLEVNLNAESDLGSVEVDTVSGVVLNQLVLTSALGSVNADLESGVEVKEKIDLSTDLGSVYFEMTDVNFSKSLQVILSTDLGSVDAVVHQSAPVASDKVVFDISTELGSITFDLNIKGNLGAMINTEKDLGDSNVFTHNFSGNGPYKSDNYEDATSKFDFFLETNLGGIDVDATYQP